MTFLRKYTAYILYYLGDVAYMLYGKLMALSADIQGDNGNGPWDIHDQEYHFEKKKGMHGE